MYQLTVWDEPVWINERPGSRPGRVRIEPEDYEPFEIDDGTTEEKHERIIRALRQRSDGTWLGSKR
jgi:hypothetical protein